MQKRPALIVLFLVLISQSFILSAQQEPDSISKFRLFSEEYKANKVKYLKNSLRENSTLFKIAIPPNKFASTTSNLKNFNAALSYGIERKIFTGFSLSFTNDIYYQQLVSHRKDEEVLVKTSLLTFNYELRYYFLKKRRIMTQIDADNLQGLYVGIEAGNLPIFVLKNTEDYHLYRFRKDKKIFSNVNTTMGLQYKIFKICYIDAGINLAWHYNVDIFAAEIKMLMGFGF